MGLLIFTRKEKELLRLHNLDMKRLLIPLLAAIVLPTAANAETYWLIIIANRGPGDPNVMEKVPMTSLKECEAAGSRLHGDRTIHGNSPYMFENMRVVCIKGK